MFPLTDNGVDLDDGYSSHYIHNDDDDDIDDGDHDIVDDDDDHNDDGLEVVELLGRVTSYLIPASLTNATVSTAFLAVNLTV